MITTTFITLLYISAILNIALISYIAFEKIFNKK